MTIANSSAHNILVNLGGSVLEAGAESGAGVKAAVGIADDVTAEADGFWSMLSQNLSRVLADGDQQTIENKEILAAIGEFENALQNTTEEQLPAEWMHVLKSHFSELFDTEEIDSASRLSDQESPITDLTQIPGGLISAAIQQVMVKPDDGRGLPPGRQQMSERMILPIVPKPSLDPNLQAVTEPVNRLTAEMPVVDPELDMEFTQRFALESAKVTELPNKLQSNLLAATDFTSAFKSADGTPPSQLTAGLLGAATATTAPQTPTVGAEARVLQGTLSTTQPQWGSALGERISFMINQHLNSAEIRMDPPQLGKLDIQIQVKDDAATIVIHTQHSQTRDLVDAASVRLREYLQEAGYQSVDVDVSHRESSSGQGEFADRTGKDDAVAHDQSSELDLTVAESGTAATIMVSDGRIDYFA